MKTCKTSITKRELKEEFLKIGKENTGNKAPSISGIDENLISTFFHFFRSLLLAKYFLLYKIIYKFNTIQFK